MISLYIFFFLHFFSYYFFYYIDLIYISFNILRQIFMSEINRMSSHIYKAPIRRHNRRNGTIISAGGSGAPNATANKDKISDALNLIHSILENIRYIDRNGMVDVLSAVKNGYVNEYTQNHQILLKLMNEIQDNERKTLLDRKMYLSDLEFSHFILNSFYMKFFAEFIISPHSKIVYRGIRSSFKLYDVPLYRMRIFILNKAVVKQNINTSVESLQNSISNKYDKNNILELENQFRKQLMLMTQNKQLPPVIFSAILPVFKAPGILDHMQYIVEHDEYKQLLSIRKDTALSSMHMENDWDTVFDPINQRGGSFAKPDIHKSSLHANTFKTAPRIGHLGRDVGVAFAYAMIIPQRMSTTLRSALLLRNDTIDRSLGPEIRALFTNLISNDFTTFEFTLDDILLELSVTGSLERVRLGFLYFEQSRILIYNHKNNIKKSLEESVILFVISFYCAALIEISRLNIAADIIASGAIGTSGFVPSNPLVPFLHVDCDGNVSKGIELLTKACTQSNFIKTYIDRIMGLWKNVRIRTAHRTSIVDRLFPIQNNYTAGSVGDLMVIILSQYENVDFRPM